MKVSEYQNWLSKDITSSEVLRDSYGTDPGINAARKQGWLQALDGFASRYGNEREVILVRAPGRANLMGMHIDHQGGANNHILISREILVVGSPNHDSQKITIANRDEKHREFEWRAGSEQAGPTGDNSKRWWNYLNGVLRTVFEKSSPERGANLFISSNLPAGATLSSSTALSVALCLALCQILWRTPSPNELIDFAFQSEAKAGVEGDGPGDQTAIVSGKRGHLTHVEYHPLRLKYIPIPGNCAVIICNSGERAAKLANAQTDFQRKITAYLIGHTLINISRKKEGARSLPHLRDLNSGFLGVPDSEIYRIIKSLPLSAGTEELVTRFGSDLGKSLTSRLEAEQTSESGYSVRGTCLYGIAEHARAVSCIDLLKKEDLKGFGRLMVIGHDGDRLVTWNRSGSKKIFLAAVPTDAMIDRLIDQSPLLRTQSGLYQCSTELLDFIVDTAMRCEGVYGARLTGSGLGGCAVVLCEKSRAIQIRDTITGEFTALTGAEPNFWIDETAAPAGLIGPA